MHKPTLPGYTEVLDPADDNKTHPLIAAAQRKLNRALRGRVVVDYDTRTVVFKDIDGDHAMRLLALANEHEEGEPASARWADQLDPRTAEAGARWIFFRPERILSIRWFPERMLVIDDAHAKELDVALKLLDLVADEPERTTNARTAQEPSETEADEDSEDPADDDTPDAEGGDDEDSANVAESDVPPIPTTRASPQSPPE